MACVVSSPSEVGVWVSALVIVGGVIDRFTGSDTSSVCMRGGMGECADLSMNNMNSVDALIVFIMLNCTFGRALTQPV